MPAHLDPDDVTHALGDTQQPGEPDRDADLPVLLPGVSAALDAWWACRDAQLALHAAEHARSDAHNAWSALVSALDDDAFDEYSSLVRTELLVAKHGYRQPRERRAE